MIRVVHPGSESRIWILIFTNPRSRGQKGTGSRIRIRNTAAPTEHDLADLLKRQGVAPTGPSIGIRDSRIQLHVREPKQIRFRNMIRTLKNNHLATQNCSKAECGNF
jgi:hypothetical protein